MTYLAGDQLQAKKAKLVGNFSPSTSIYPLFLVQNCIYMLSDLSIKIWSAETKYS